MRQILFILLLLLVTSFAIETRAGEAPILDGHKWDDAGGAKPAIILGFMKGYTYGRARGALIGLESALETFKNILCPKPKEQGCDEHKIKEAVLSTVAKIEEPFLLSDRKVPRTMGFYAKEVDAFYQTFPLCKRLELFPLLSDLMEVWDGKKSYKEAGDKCLEAPK